MRAALTDFVDRHEVAWELTMGGLAIVYVLVGFAAEGGGASASAMLGVEAALTVAFVLEFSLRLWAAPSRQAYIRSHWIDLVALIPTIRQFRVLRVLRLLRLVRTFAGLYRALLHVERILGNRQIATIGVIWLAILVLTSFGMYAAENGVNDAVDSPLDALWWGVTTMTTVGYGDIYPVTPEGRVAASILMILGIALFGVITATATGLLIKPPDDRHQGTDADVLVLIERLFSLVSSGAISREEFDNAKVRLLARI